MANDAADAIKTALSERFGEDFTIDRGMPGLNALAEIVGHRSHRRYLPRAGRAGAAAAPVRLRAFGAVEKRSAAVRYRDRRRCGGPPSDRGDHSRHAVDHGRAGLPGLRRKRRAAPGNGETPWQAVPERSSRPVLQRCGRCRHRAGDLHARRGGGRAWLLPDQRDPRSSANGERPAAHAGPGRSGRRPLRRLAGAGRRDHAAAVAEHHRG